MLTNHGTEAVSASWSAACVGAAMIASVMGSVLAATSAHAGDTTAGTSETSCLGGWTDFNCVTRWGPGGDPYVRTVPQAVGAEKARVSARERPWLARCRPVMTHDSYGVARYHYAAPGCEFGVGED